MSLLEKALAKAGRRKHAVPDADTLELAIAFFNGRVNYGQVAAALGLGSTGPVGQSMAAALRNASIAGLVDIKAVTP